MGSSTSRHGKLSTADSPMPAQTEAIGNKTWDSSRDEADAGHGKQHRVIVVNSKGNDENSFNSSNATGSGSPLSASRSRSVPSRNPLAPVEPSYRHQRSRSMPDLPVHIDVDPSVIPPSMDPRSPSVIRAMPMRSTPSGPTRQPNESGVKASSSQQFNFEHRRCVSLIEGPVHKNTN